MIILNSILNEGHVKSTGFWLKDSTLYPINKTHIRAVLDQPQLFGYEKTELIKVFRRFNEKIGFEGKARKDIITDVVSRDWIRIRHYIRPVDYWSVQCSDEVLQRDEIQAFIEYVMSKGILRADDTVMVNGMKMVF